MAHPMANDPPFATLNHFTGDLRIPSESEFLKIGISYKNVSQLSAVVFAGSEHGFDAISDAV
jgi:hypothetical protein